jgi:hypothetical protein
VASDHLQVVDDVFLLQALAKPLLPSSADDLIGAIAGQTDLDQATPRSLQTLNDPMGSWSVREVWTRSGPVAIPL